MVLRTTPFGSSSTLSFDLDLSGLGGGMIQARNLTITFDRRAVIHHLNFSLETGKTLAILGPNGSGKSTLTRTIAGLHTRFEGHLDISFSRRQRGYLPQQSQVDRSLPVTTRELVMSGLFAQVGAFRKPTPAEITKAELVFEQMNLREILELPIKALSGGQMQRALWARLILLDPSLILLDEPFNYLDEDSLKKVLQQIIKWREVGKSIVMVLHDALLAPKISDQVLNLRSPTPHPSPILCLDGLQTV